MEPHVDHYHVLGLPSGEEGANLTEKEISKAYKLKALELHPDKRPDNPNAHIDFQKIKTSYEILKDEKARKVFDDLLRLQARRQSEQARRQSEQARRQSEQARRQSEQARRQSERDVKRRRMVSDLEEKERAAFAPDSYVKEREEEERIARQLKEEIARIRAMHSNKGGVASMHQDLKKGSVAAGKEGGSSCGLGLEKEKVLKVSWEKVGQGYSAEKLMALFSNFGAVEDVVIKSSKKKGSALVVMATKEGAVTACGTVSGELCNPLLVLPLQPVIGAEFPTSQKPREPDRMANLVGSGHHAFEDFELKKFQKAAEKRK